MKGMRLFARIRRELGLSGYKMGPVVGRTLESLWMLERRTCNPNLKDIIAYHDFAVRRLKWTSSRYIEELREEVAMKDAAAKRNGQVVRERRGCGTRMVDNKHHSVQDESKSTAQNSSDSEP